MASADEPIACTLTPGEAADQLGEWAQLRSRVTAIEAVDGGWSMRFPAGIAAEVEDLARREAACCAFLDLRTTVEDGAVRLDITSTNADATAVIELLVGRSELAEPSR